MKKMKKILMAALLLLSYLVRVDVDIGIGIDSGGGGINAGVEMTSDGGS